LVLAVLEKQVQQMALMALIQVLRVAQPSQAQEAVEVLALVQREAMAGQAVAVWVAVQILLELELLDKDLMVATAMSRTPRPRLFSAKLWLRGISRQVSSPPRRILMVPLKLLGSGTSMVPSLP
jgi:hypothetical protein